MGQYQFDCEACQGITCYLLHGKDTFDLSRARCEWCQSKRVKLSLYYRDAGELIEALQEQIGDLELRIDALEFPEPLDEDNLLTQTKPRRN